MSVFFEGFLLTLGFILSIGPQNTYILKQGASRQNVFVTALLSGLFNGVLLTLGIFGAGKALMATYPDLKAMLLWGGCLFLGGFSAHSFFLCWKGRPPLTLKAKPTSFKSVALKALFLSWVNPINILENVILIGTFSTYYQHTGLHFFTMGALCAPFLIFFSLGYGAYLFSAYMSSSKTWRIIDGFVGMICLGATLRVIGLATGNA